MPSKMCSTQRGQILVLTLGLLTLGAVLLMTVWSAGQVTLTKQRLVDTADAAAWSGALWRARVLNFHAYSNRAMIANEVAIAQAVTLLAWAKYFETLTRQTALVGQLVPPARSVLEAIAQTAHLARQSAELAATIEVPARGAAVVGYNAILQASQELLQLSSGGFGINLVTAEVARATDPRFFAWVLPDPSLQWTRLTERSQTLAQRQRVANLVRASLDRFTSGPRTDEIHTPLPSSCLNFHRLRKRGGTSLSSDLRRWEAADTLSFHHRSLRWFKCRESESIALGWGAVETGVPRHRLESNPGDVALNPRARNQANASMTSIAGYSGFATGRELAFRALSDSQFPRSDLAVVVRVEGPRVATAQNRHLASGRVSPSDRFAGQGAGHMWALAAAEVYFRRPIDADPRTEFASLFNPYWHVRLVAPSSAQQAAAQVAVHAY
jgi:hypothetical protein